MPEDRWRRVREFICCFYKAEERAESIKVEIIHEVALQQGQLQQQRRQVEEGWGEGGGGGGGRAQGEARCGSKGRHVGQKDFNLRLVVKRWREGDPDPTGLAAPT